jgi:hypothetical protein
MDYTSNFRKFDIDEILQEIETKLSKQQQSTSMDSSNTVKSTYTSEMNLLEAATQQVCFFLLIFLLFPTFNPSINQSIYLYVYI